MIEFTMVLGEEDRRELYGAIEEVIGDVRGMMESYREIESKRISNKIKRLFKREEDNAGLVMSDLVSCCSDISDDIAIGIYDEEPDNIRLVSDLSELAYLIGAFLRESRADKGTYLAALEAYMGILEILKGMVIN